MTPATRRIVLLLALASSPVLPAACARTSSPPSAPPAVAPAPADTLVAGRPSFLAVADTVVTVSRAGGAVTIRDRRTLRREASGDFDAEVRRDHQGADAGDTGESFRAIRAGSAYFTRGSGGPFVRWDDAGDEADAAAAAILQGSRDLLAIVASCGRESVPPEHAGGGERIARQSLAGAGVASGPSTEGAIRTVALASPACPVASAPGGAPFTATLARLEGEMRRDGDRLASLRLVMGLEWESGDRRAAVTVEHSLALSDLPPGPSVAAPSDAVPARRERPVVMARQVLGGLVDAWGPGAPEVLRKPPSPDR